MNPIIPIHGAEFVYTDSWNTDIRKRFDRIRREQKPVVENVLADRITARVSTWGIK